MKYLKNISNSFFNELNNWLGEISIVIILPLLNISYPFAFNSELERQILFISFAILIFTGKLLQIFLYKKNSIWDTGLMETVHANAREYLEVKFRAFLFAPILEELIYRIICISIFYKLFNSLLIAALLSSILFALAHRQYGYRYFISYIADGIAFAFLTITMGIIFSMFFHCLLNLSFYLHTRR